MFFNMRRMLLVAALASAISGCQTSPISPNAKSEVASAAQGWRAAFNNCDIDRLMAFYDPEAVLMGTVSPVIISGSAGVRQYFEKVCSAKPSAQVAFGDQLIRVYGDAAVNSGTWTFTIFPQGQQRMVRARYSGTYRHKDGKWLIVDHHSSVIPSAAVPPAAR